MGAVDLPNTSRTGGTAPTAHEKIRIYVDYSMPAEDMVAWANYLRETRDTPEVGRLVVALKEIVLDYSPSTHLLKRGVEPRRRPVALAATG